MPTEKTFTDISQNKKDAFIAFIPEILEKDIVPGTYNIADDEPLSTNRLIELIAASKAKRAKIWNINPEIISFAARAGDKLHLPLTGRGAAIS